MEEALGCIARKISAVLASHLERVLAGVEPTVHLTPMTRDRAVASEWLRRFEGAGLDGVIAKPGQAPYEPGRRTMIKVKHIRTADCVVAGLRWHKSGRDRVGSLLLGLYDAEGMLQHVGVTSAFPMAVRKQLALELAPLRKDALQHHPWREWAGAASGEFVRKWCHASNASMIEKRATRYLRLGPARSALSLAMQVGFYLSPAAFNGIGRLTAQVAGHRRPRRSTYSPGVPGLFVDHHILTIQRPA